nr:transposon Ty3-G Gag-Pol polyprotein [Tanacetum cinerariifolium]
MKQLQQELAKLMETIMAMNTKIQALENQDHAGRMNASGEPKPYLKLFFPRFSAEDPQGWVYQAEQYLEFQKVAEGDRIALASFHLDGIALQCTGGTLRHRDPSHRQNLQKHFLFDSGRLTTKTLQRPFIGSNNPPRWSFTKTPLRALPVSKPIRRLSNNEARERRMKGLCYYCDDKYTPGHKYSKPHFFMIGDAKETENENPTNDALETQADEVQGEISFHAISGTILPQTLRLPERIQNKDVVVLVDGGSTHNIVDQELVNRLGLQVDPTVNFLVVVATWKKLACTGRVRNLSLIVQGCVISTDFFVLPVLACPIVLGVQWLKTLGPIEFDFNNLIIGF